MRLNSDEIIRDSRLKSTALTSHQPSGFLNAYQHTTDVLGSEPSPWSPLSFSCPSPPRANTCQIASGSSAPRWFRTSDRPTTCSGCTKAGDDSATRCSDRSARPVGCANRCGCPWQRSAPIRPSDGRGSEIKERSPCESVLLLSRGTGWTFGRGSIVMGMKRRAGQQAPGTILG